VSIEETQNEIIEQFQAYGDWRERYRHIIALGKDLGEFPEEHRTDDNIVKGCQNRVWLHAELTDDGLVHFEADSEASIVKGLVALLLKIYSNHTPDEIISTPPTFIQELQLGENLTMNRANGLASMIKQMKFYAMGFKVLQARG